MCDSWDGGYDIETVGDILDGLRGKQTLIIPSQRRAIFF
jgi:hypothetical protein